MPRAFGGSYIADRDPTFNLLMGQSTNNAAALMMDAKNITAFDILIEMLNNFIDSFKEWTHIDLGNILPIQCIENIVHAITDQYNPDGSKMTIIDRIAALVGAFNDLFEFTPVLEAWWGFLEAWFTFEWITHPLKAIHDAWMSVVDLISAWIHWILHTFHLITGIELPDFFAIEILVDGWTAFNAVWWSLDWFGQPIQSVTAAWRATVDLGQCIIHWGQTLFTNLTGVEFPGFFELQMLKDIWSDFFHSFDDFEWLHLEAYWDAIDAVVTLLLALPGWALLVLRNLTTLDFTGLWESLNFAGLWGCIHSCGDTLIGLNWLAPGQALMDAIGAVIGMFKCIGNWLLVTLHDVIAWDMEFVHDMFSSVENFIKKIVEFFTGITGLEIFQNVLDVLSGLTGGSLSGAVKGLMDFIPNLSDLFGVASFAGIITTMEDFAQGIVGLFNGNGLGGLSVGGIFGDIVGSMDGWLGGLPDLISNLIEEVIGDVRDTIQDIIDKLFGVFGGNGIGNAIEDLVERIETWMQGIPVIGDIISQVIAQVVHAITGITNGGLSHLTTWARDVLNIRSGIPASNLIGQISSALLPSIPVAHITDTNPNLLTDADFGTASVMQTGNGWEWDSETNHSGTGGSAKVTNDGSVKSLLSNPVSVAAGQILNVSAWVMSSNLVGTGAPIGVGVRTFNNGVAVSNTVLAASAGTDGEWVELTGQITIPPQNVDAVRVRLSVTDASSGAVWFDDASMTKEGLLKQGLVANLVDDLNLKADVEKFHDLLDTLADKAQAEFADVSTRLHTFLHNLSPLNGSNISEGDIDHQFISSLVDTWQGVVSSLGQGIRDPSESGVQNFTPLQNIWEALTHHQAVVTSNASDVSLLSTQLKGLSNDLGSLRAAVLAIPSAPYVPPVGSGGTGGTGSGGGSTGGGGTTVPPTIQGITVSDDFERTSSASLGSYWSQWYPYSYGVLATPDGSDALWVPPGPLTSHQADGYALFSTSSNTDYQVTNCILGSSPVNPIGIGGANAANFLLLRAANASYCMKCIWWANGIVEIIRVDGGVETVLSSGSTSVPGAGSTIAFAAGDKASSTLRTFTAYQNGSPVLNATDSVSNYGAGYRGWGFGVHIGLKSAGIGQALAGRVNAWAAADQ